MRASGEAFTARQAGQERRGQDLMDEARDVLAAACPEWALHIYGDGPLVPVSAWSSRC